ncbi:MAG: MarR family transcriptional regulator [Solirubrobacterales bacterium]
MASGSDTSLEQAPGAGLPGQSTGDHVDRIVVEWGRAIPDLNTDAIALMGRLVRAARLLQIEIDKTLGAFDLTINEFNALCALRRSDPPHRLSPKAVGVSLLFSSGGLTKLLERLEKRGLISREPDPNDGRGVLISLTPYGRELQERAMRAHQANEEELLSPLSMSQRDVLNSTLRDLLIAYEASAGRMRPIVAPARSGEPDSTG